ncbi:MAG: imidazole glycerol phosphate synthase subunit HisH [Clostridiaceae bacterium]|nr:imidazole glycerol phosphate synthase subunit HisH [Clostridiaceae bacterium]
MIAIIDYGIGNLRSVQKALEYIGLEGTITSDKEIILNSQGVILPGVGAFPDAMDNLKAEGLDLILKKVKDENKPILGICLGMQLLFQVSEEIRSCPGLGFIPGKIKKLYGEVKIPHMGWNSLNIVNNNPLIKGIKEADYVYFVHSFYAEMGVKEDLIAECSYGIQVPAVVGRGNVYGTQFHPEKSGDIGIQILKNFGELIK